MCHHGVRRQLGPDKKIFSGKQLEDLLQAICAALWTQQTVASAKAKAKKPPLAATVTNEHHRDAGSVSQPRSTIDAGTCDAVGPADPRFGLPSLIPGFETQAFHSGSAENRAPSTTSPAAENRTPAVTSTAAVLKSMPENWVPKELLAFCWLGPLSGNCITAFGLETSEGPGKRSKAPPSSSSSLSSPGSSSSSDSEVALTQASVINEAFSRSELRKLQKTKKGDTAAAALQVTLKENSAAMGSKLEAMTAVIAAAHAESTRLAQEKTALATRQFEEQQKQRAIAQLRELIDLEHDPDVKKGLKDRYSALILSGLPAYRAV